ncbi:MAG: TetR/AcrR family transcriptional regulator [Roseburia sp.]|nr:TetR/AcrR family transcriptional regulator [Roseburia sp.]
MPPKAKFTREEIQQMAFEIARTEGIEKLTSRELGKRLGSSARPIFTVYENMDELKNDVIGKAKELYKQYVTNGLKKEIAFKGVGMSYIRFSIEEPILFQLLFMTPLSTLTDVTNILPLIDASYEDILKSVQDLYGLDRPAADKLYQHLWTYTHGIAAMCATKLCSYSEEEISQRLTEVFTGLLFLEKNKEKSKGANNDKN